jgi:Zn-dependent protease
MFQSLRLGKFFGIDLYVHGTFWLLPLFILFSGLSAGATLAEAGTDVAFIVAVFGCVVLHEVGHALAARAYGIGTRDITLYPIGGVASLERMPENPGREIAIALAGPAVNFVIAGALFVGFLGASYLTPWAPTVDVGGLDLFLAQVMVANLVLGVFNLLPCFPMDGGRVLRAVLATRLTRVRATAVAVGVGSVMAVAFVIFGVYVGNLGLVLLAAVVWLLGQGELAAVRAQAVAREMRERFGEWYEPRPAGMPPVGSDFTGLVWDENRRVWIQYENGEIVRVIDPSS